MSAPRYSLTERDRRWKLAREFMAKEGVEALIVWGDHEDGGPNPYYLDTWFTNDHPGSVVIFPRTGRPRVFIARPRVIVDHLRMSTEERGGPQSPWLEPTDYILGGRPEDVTKTLKDLGLKTVGVLGLETFMPFYPFGIIPYSYWAKVLDLNPNISFKSEGLAQAFQRLTVILGEEEIEMVRHAAKVADAMADAIVAAAKPGVSELELWSVGMAAAYRFGTAVPILFMYTGPNVINFGPPIWTYHPATPRTIEDGDIVACEILGGYGKREAQVQITLPIGSVHSDYELAADIAHECYKGALDVLRPGKTFGEVVRAIRKPIEDAGAWSKGPQIHTVNPHVGVCEIDMDFALVGAGTGYPGKWKLPTFGADLVLEPGMTFAVEPTCAFGNHAVTVGGTVIVGQDDPIELNPRYSKIPRSRA